MIVGNKERFAIESEWQEEIDGWTLGSFRFWLCGNSVGDWNDTADLNGCVRWLQEFSENPRERYEQGLFELSPKEVFSMIYDPVMPGITEGPPQARVADAYARFHISHLGMSSFERFDLLLLKDEHGAERCLWREVGRNEIMDCRLWRNEMERVAAEFCKRFTQARCKQQLDR